MKNYSIGGDWYQYCDVVFTPFKDLIGSEILPKSHIFSWSYCWCFCATFFRGPANSGKGRWAEFDINRYNIQIPH